MNADELKKYRKKAPYSYSLGSFPTFELLQSRPETAEMILIHSDAKAEIRHKLMQECERAGVKMISDNRPVEKLRDKENCMVIGVFRKYRCRLFHNADHVVLVNPGDMGNLGTIIRSCAGFGITNLAIIEPAADIFHPRVVRASMGAVFKMTFSCFPSFYQYDREYGGERENYPFMLDGEYPLGTFTHPAGRPYSLIFGNEACGLDASYLRVGKSVCIPHTRSIDSLNLSVAAGIGLYAFMPCCKAAAKQENHRKEPPYK